MSERAEGLTEGQRQHLEALIGLLDREGLLELRGLVDTRLSELEQPTQPAELVDGAPSPGLVSSKGSRGSGWIELKMINGFGPYAYRRWRTGGKLRSEYLGKVKQGLQAGS